MEYKEIVAIDLINKNGEVSQRIALNKENFMWKLCNCGFEEKTYVQKVINMLDNGILPPLSMDDTFGLQKLR